MANSFNTFSINYIPTQANISDSTDSIDLNYVRKKFLFTQAQRFDFEMVTVYDRLVQLHIQSIQSTNSKIAFFCNKYIFIY